jgi:tetratricopeptide (TPR) repeat protein
MARKKGHTTAISEKESRKVIACSGKKEGSFVQFEVTDEPPFDFFQKYAISAEDETLYQKTLDDLIDAKNIDTVIERLQKLVKTYPNCPSFFSSLSTAYFIAGDTKRFRNATELAYKRFPDDLFIKCQMGDFLLS